MEDAMEHGHLGVPLRAKAYAALLSTTLVVAYLTNKTGYYYSRHGGIHREHAPNEWGEALGVTINKLPWLVLLFVVLVGVAEAIIWGRRATGDFKGTLRSARAALQRWLAPRYDEVTLFVMSVSFVLLLATDQTLRSTAFAVVRQIEDIRELIVPTLFLGGLVLSVYHAWTKRRKSNLEQTIMLFFAVGLHFGASLVASAHLLENPSGGIHWIFPTWNVVSWMLLVLLWRFDVLDATDSIGPDDAGRYQILIAMGLTLGLVLLGKYVADYHWTMTLSMTVAVASFVGRGIEQFTSPPSSPTRAKAK